VRIAVILDYDFKQKFESNMLKMRYFFEKKSPSSGGSALRLPQSYPHQLYCTVLLQNVLILSPIKNQFWLAKFGAILVPSLFVILPLTSPGLATELIESIVEEERLDVFEDARFWFCSKRFNFT